MDDSNSDERNPFVAARFSNEAFIPGLIRIATRRDILRERSRKVAA